MNYYIRYNLRLKNIRKTKIAINKAVKELNKLGVFAVHTKKYYDSYQVLYSGLDVDPDSMESYLIVNKIREGKHTTPDKLYLLWKGDIEIICSCLTSYGLNVVTPENDKQTIIVNIDLFKEGG